MLHGRVYPGQATGTIPLYLCFIALRTRGVKVRFLQWAEGWVDTVPGSGATGWSAWRRGWWTRSGR